VSEEVILVGSTDLVPWCWVCIATSGSDRKEW